MKEYTAEFKDQAVRFVLEEIEPNESRKHACDRLAPKLSVKPVTLYNWVKQSTPGKTRSTAPPGSVEGLRAQITALKKENRELARANAMADSTGQRNDTSELVVSSPRRNRCKVSMDICRWSRSSTRFGCVREDGVWSTLPGRSGAPPPWSVSWFATEGTLMPSRSAGSRRLGA